MKAPLLLILGAASSHAAVFTVSLSGDNDFTLYTGNASGSSLTEHVNQVTDWNFATNGSFSSNDSHIYVSVVNWGGPGNFHGFINGVDITTVPWETTGNILPQISNFVSHPSFNPIVSDIEAIATNETFSPAFAVNTTVIGVPGASSGLFVQSGFTGQVFRTSVENFGVTVSAVPEPSSAVALAGLLASSLLLRRRNA